MKTVFAITTTKTGPCASFLFAVLALLLAGCAEKPEQLVFNGLSMGTTYQVKVVPGKVDVPEDLSTQIQRELDLMDHTFTTYSPDSELSAINHSPLRENFPISAAMLQVLQVSGDVYRLTGGAFDPTVGPLVNLWGFGPDPSKDVVPPQPEIDKLRAKVGLDNLELDAQASAVRRDTDIQLDLSAVAKGYAVDAVAKLLDSLGFSNYLVEVGGELRISGVKAGGEPWRIAIESPELERHGVQQALTPGAVAVATSGDYRNYFEKDGKRYSHTIDPRTGYPISHGLASVTVIAPTTAYADAMATGMMVLGHEAALELAKKNDLAVYLLVKEKDGFKAYSSPAFGRYLTGE